MTAITRNLPWFIQDLGVSIIGQECYTSLVEKLNISDGECIKYSLSKALGIGIVVGGAIMKVPQIVLIVNAHSARGLSFPAYILETLSYAITLAYSFRHHFPFSTYGENLFLTIQNIVITLLILYYAPTRRLSSTIQSMFAVALSAAISGFILATISLDTVALLQVTTLPLSLFSKLPQIRQNFHSQSTGQLSAFAILSQIAGCLARLFTTATEVGDVLVLSGFALALFLNLILGAQLWMYWDQNEEHRDEFEFRVSSDEKTVHRPSSWQPETLPPPMYSPANPILSFPLPSGPALNRTATPPLHAQPAGRKWARKVD